MKSFSERVAVITGAGNGLGLAMCRERARRGANIAAVDIDEAGLTSVRQEVESLGRR